jgi:LPXTG-motif cell wall-anchored protein
MGSRWLSRFAVATAAAGALTLVVATSAWADTKIFVNPAQVPTTALEFGGGDDCIGPLAGLPDGVDGWHLVLPSSSGDNFVSLTLTFSKPGGGTATAVITSTNSSAPSTGAGWSGYIDNAGGSDKHAYVFTDAGWTLTAGEAIVTGDVGKHPQFVLSHTCADTGSSTPPSNPPSDGGSSPSDGGSTPGGGSSSGGGSDTGGGLPITGTAVGGMVVVGIGLLAAGVALMAVRRRRDLSDLTDI